MKVSNRKCIRNISLKNMRSAKLKNIVAILAIALTTLLFTALFTIVISLVHGIEQQNFRQVGGYEHGGFKYLTYEQFQELKDDPLIKEYGIRRVAGMAVEKPFHKSHVEISWCDQNSAKWMFLDPIEGRLPKEGTNEAATDLEILRLLGVEPKIGAQFTIPIVNGTQTVMETFTLCGWWEYDEVVVANHVMIPESRLDEIICKFDAANLDKEIGTYMLNVMYKSSRNIAENNKTILERHGYQNEDQSKDNFISTGVNWGYMSAQLDSSLDIMTIISVVGVLALIIFTGYLIIYNVFQISVSNDIRFYGMLKTIGTTGRQIRKILYIQAYSLSIIGIPLGMAAGYFSGVVLAKVIAIRMNAISLNAFSANPLIFLFSAVFTLLTVVISCRKPAKYTARVSPIEALRYVEGATIKRTVKKSKKGASVSKMAWANIGRNRIKTAVTISSLALAVVLLNITVTFANSFDMEKYINKFIVADYLVANASHLETNGIFWSENIAVEENVITEIKEQTGIADSGKTYGFFASEFVPESHYKGRHSRHMPQEQVDIMFDSAVKENGWVMDDTKLYGMEDFCLDKLRVLEGSLDKLYEGGNYMAAVYVADDYGEPEWDRYWNWAKVGDTVKIRYVEEYEFYNIETGEIYEDIDNISIDVPVASRPTTYHDKEYEVVALVIVPSQLNYRSYGTDQFVMNVDTFLKDTNSSAVMYYAYDMDHSKPEDIDKMETFLEDYTQNVADDYGYESRKTKESEFSSFKNMFMFVGSALSFIVALVGILNFMNSIVTGILSRKQELAMLQAVGMTGKQLKQMLVLEGVYESAGAVLTALVLTILTAPLTSNILSSAFWFLTYQFTISPIFIIAPLFTLLGILIPYWAYRFMVKKSVVERLRETE